MAAVMVIVSMFVLLGMLVLALDIGGLLLKHRAMVNSNDSAALAAAISFARDEAQLGSNELPARSAADSYALDNVPNAQRYAAPPDDPDGPAPDGFKVDPGIPGSDCTDCGKVTVWYLGHTSAFFAQIFGYGKDVAVREKAQAIWGPAGGGQPNPIMVRFDWMQNDCDKPVPPPDDEINITCRFWLDDSGIGDAQWSFLNLISDRNDPHWGWDVPRIDVPQVFPGCTNVGNNQVDDWIAQRAPTGQLGLNFPDATYVCRVTGRSADHFRTFQDQIGTFRIFPVNCPEPVPGSPCAGSHGQVDKDGNLCPPPCTPAKYDIIGFTILRIDNVLHGNDPAAYGDPGSQNNLCTPPISRTFTTAPGPDHTYDLNTQAQCGLLNLHLPGDATKLYPRIRESNGNKVYQYGQAPGPNVDYTYDPATQVITWVSLDPLNQIVLDARVDWEYDIAPSPGACGIRQKNANATCLLASWQGFQSGGINPGEGADTGLRAVRLSE
ncbi:MAG TPA: pilus assembly protein TadG-related protein [Actinomycetota bacterium]|nr:pilus assembly protein TadG-related protein [Actinomycetota bacterium]